MTVHTQEYIRKIVHYNQDTGIFTWLVKVSLKVAIGTQVGSLNGAGYLQTSIEGTPYYLHRLAFLYVLGKMPVYVDHIDRDTVNNSWKNLRAVTNSQNQMNKAASYKNSTGIKGIAILDQCGRNYYHCQVRLDGRQYGKKFRFYEHNKQEVLPLAITWLEQKRVELHKEFTRHI